MPEEKELQPTKLKAIIELIFSSNWILYTDNSSMGNVSPLYTEKFIDKTNKENERLRLIAARHKNQMDALADRELGNG